ncbi:tax1-binding protein 1 homolog [Neodiprion fabricii]|uniref:tax1-binding protein 1 homolog n=1 Tax=Neodiprion fabricii TaxID=2872261 RepID=UPI001ED9303E|nr:tax1-binding protein 1 homolog [Neodiprion fabricii]
MQCCGSWNTGCCPTHHPVAVTFENLRTKYSVNEDIRVEYTLHGHVQQASTRDWLGIFPRGWSNLQQYLTFEYALVAPKTAASPNRTIIFPRMFHQEASTNTEYQLVYVTREIQVLAVSPYFRFVGDRRLDSTNYTLRIPAGRQQASSIVKQEPYIDRLAVSGWGPPRIVLSDQSLLSLRPSRGICGNPRLSSASCRSCGRPREHICGLAAGRARFLATHNASLTERVLRLEQDLALAEGAKSSLASRLRAYENFVAEMLRSLATNRRVKITDAAGKEIILQQLSENPDERKSDNDQTEEREFRQGNDPQTNQINDPHIEDLDFLRNRIPVDEYLTNEKFIPTKDDRGDGRVQWISPDDSRRKIETEKSPEENKEQVQEDEENVDRETSTDEVKDLRTKVENSNESREEIPPKVRIKEIPADVAGLTSAIGVSTADEKNEKAKIELDDENKALESKPSAIVIQGSNVKFAIIRYQ